METCLDEDNLGQSRRFFLNDEGNIVDKLNPARDPVYNPVACDPDDEPSLRERVLFKRLYNLVDDLIINPQPEFTSHDGAQYKPYNEEAGSIMSAIYYAILASILNTQNPALSFENRFDGNLKRNKEGLNEYTSIAFFRDDVERLLRDLYGDVDSRGLDLALSAVAQITYEFTKFVRKDLWQEEADAWNWDFLFGIGVPDGCGIGGSDHRRGHFSLSRLKDRALELRKNPSAFSKYTIEFANHFLSEYPIERIPSLDHPCPGRPDHLEDDDIPF